MHNLGNCTTISRPQLLQGDQILVPQIQPKLDPNLQRVRETGSPNTTLGRSPVGRRRGYRCEFRGGIQRQSLDVFPFQRPRFELFCHDGLGLIDRVSENE